MLLWEMGVRVATGQVAWIGIGPPGGENIKSLLVSQGGATILAGTSAHGLLKTVDGGITWAAATAGFSATTILALVADPNVPTTVFAGTERGVFKTQDGGSTWTLAGPELSGRVVAGLAISPIGTLYAGTDAGVAKSQNAGASWVAAGSGLPAGPVFAVATDPVAAGTLYVATAGGVFKSIDAAASWMSQNNGLTNFTVLTLAIDPSSPATVYAGARYTGPTPGLVPASGGVFKTTTAGVSWSPMNAGLGGAVGGPPVVFSLLVDPAAPATIYAGTDGAGVFQTTNGAATWSIINTGLTDLHIQALALGPSSPATIYAGTAVASVFRVSAGGAIAVVTGIIPVVISGPGRVGSFFRTSLQVTNPTPTCMAPCTPALLSGQLVFHPQGTASPADPAASFTLSPGQVLELRDVVAAIGRSGMGSLDILTSSGSIAVAFARVFNDGGPAGTYGFGMQALAPTGTLNTGDTGVLMTPIASDSRLNIGVRTLGIGGSLRVTVRNLQGQIVRTLTKQYSANYMEQTAASDFLNSPDAAPAGTYTVTPDDTLRFEVTSGNLFVYGVEADNKTNDPSLQLVVKLP